MKVTYLTITNSRKAGGLYNSVRNLARNVMNLNACEVCILSHNDKFSKEDLYAYEGIPMQFYSILGPANFGFSLNLKSKLKDLAPTIIHQQGIWTYSSLINLIYRKHHSVKTIIAPRGMLDPWAVRNSGWKKKIVGHLFEYKNLRSADCIHALCQSEYESIRKFGLNNPVAIIPNGITLPQSIHFERDHEKKILLFIGRIHPKKGIKEMLQGLALLKKQNHGLLDDWEVHIAGWDQHGHINELKQIVEIHNLTNEVKFVGSLYGEEKEKALCRANAFILPSFSEGLPMSVLEAWAYELPVVMTEFCNIPEGFERNCAIKIETTPSDICEKLIALFQMSETELAEMGKRGQDLVSQCFTWEVVAKQTIDLYKYLLGEIPKPSFVYED